MDSILIIIALTAAAGGSVDVLRARGHRLRVPVATLVIAGVTAVVSVAANLNPHLLATLGRNGDQLAAGEWWRMVTPLVAQDGGWAGTVFNLVALLVVGTLAETLYGWRVLLGVYALAGVVSEIAGYTVLQHQGFAGNSVANLGLAALCLVTCAATPSVGTRAFGVVGLIAGVALVGIANLHGVGFAAGALAGILIVLRERRTDRLALRAAERPRT